MAQESLNLCQLHSVVCQHRPGKVAQVMQAYGRIKAVIFQQGFKAAIHTVRTKDFAVKSHTFILTTALYVFTFISATENNKKIEETNI